MHNTLHTIYARTNRVYFADGVDITPEDILSVSFSAGATDKQTTPLAWDIKPFYPHQGVKTPGAVYFMERCLT